MDVLDTLVPMVKQTLLHRKTIFSNWKIPIRAYVCTFYFFIHRHNLCGYVWRSVHTCMGEYISIWVYVHMHARMYACGDIGIISMMAF